MQSSKSFITGGSPLSKNSILRVLSLILSISLVFPATTRLVAADRTIWQPPAVLSDRVKVELSQAALTAVNRFEAANQALYERMSGQTTGGHPLDSFRLLEQTLTPNKTRLGKVKILPRDLYLHLVTSDGTSQVSASVSDFPLEALALPEGTHLELHFEGAALHTFNFDVKQALIIGRFIVFTENGAYNPETGVENIYFLDLDAYETLIGKTAIPIHRIPVKTGAEGARLSILSGILHVGVVPVAMDALQIFSDAQQRHLNAVSILVDPARYVELTPLVDTLWVTWQDAMGEASEETRAQIERVIGESDAWESFLRGEVSRLETQHRHWSGAGPLVGKTADEPVSHREDLKAAQLSASKAEQALGKATVGREEIEHFLAERRTQTSFSGMVRSIGRELQATERFTNRARTFLSYLSVPRPDGPTGGVKSLLHALGMVAGAALKKKSGPDLKQGVLTILNNPIAQLGTAVLVGATLGIAFPDEMGAMVGQTLALGQQTLETVLGRGKMLFVDLGAETFDKFSAPIRNRDVVTEAYFTPERFPKVTAGVTAGLAILFGSVALTQVAVNATLLVRDLPEYYQAEREKGSGTIASLVRAMITRNERLKGAHYQALGDAEARQQQRTGEASAEFDDEKVTEIEKYFDDLEKSEKKWTTGLTDAVRKSWLYKRFLGKPSAQVQAEGAMVAETTKTTLFAAWGRATGALFSTFFGAPAIHNTGVASSSFWSGWFLFRSFIYYPGFGSTMLWYPNLMTTAGRTAERPGVLPTSWNGGLRPFWKEASGRFRRFWRMASAHDFEAMKKWEERILPIQALIQEEAVQAAFPALLNFLDNSETAKKLLQAGGIRSLGDPNLRLLDQEGRTYFTVFVNTVVERSMERVLADVLREVDPTRAELDELSVEELKVRTLGRLDALTVSVETAREVVKSVSQDSRILAEAREATQEIAGLTRSERFQRWGIRVALSAERNFLVQEPSSDQIRSRVAAIDTELASLTGSTGVMTGDRQWTQRYLELMASSRQIERVELSDRQGRNPLAMARAIRSTIATLVIDLPIEFAMMFFFMAGLSSDGGILQMVHNDAFGPNSFFYLSRFVYGGWLISVGMRLMSNVWGKLQQDEMNDGNFGEIPEPNQSRFRWYWSQVFNNPDNTLLKNYRHLSWNILLPNMRAALITYLAMDFLALGRFDLNMYIAGYIAAFAIPYEAFNQQLEQGFELSSYWRARNIPKDYLAHPRAQAWLNHHVTWDRIRWNLIYRLGWENWTGYFLRIWMGITSVAYGPRAWLRALMPGTMLPTEHILQGLAAAEERAAEIGAKMGNVGTRSIAERVTDICQGLLTRNDNSMLPENLPEGRIRDGYEEFLQGNGDEK